MASDDNSQDYEGYKRAAENDLSEETASSGKKDAPDLTSDAGEEAGDMIDTGITKEDEIRMGLRNPDGSLVKSDLFKDDLGQPADGSLPDEDDNDDDEEEYKADVSEAAQTAPLGENDIKGPENYPTNDEPATAAQKSYISRMAVDAKEEVPFELTKAEAYEKIHDLQRKTGRDDSTEHP